MRRGIRVRGTVQGVGFRPAVYRLASELALCGLVRNDSEGVWIEVQGPALQLDRFVTHLPHRVPPLGRIDEVRVIDLPLARSEEFKLLTSTRQEVVQALIPGDAATCLACLVELFDPRDRRYRYPFINCTDCGPRYTLVCDVPYDRARTTMSTFPLCTQCRREYDDPDDRRFHAEPNACPICGPRLRFVHGDPAGPEQAGEAALSATVAALAQGLIVAVKGLGGFHLAVDAQDSAAVARLRTRKHRPHRPLAVMVRAIDEAAALVELDDAARCALTSPARPIVLCHRRRAARLAPEVAPGLDEIGVMLPYTPLHHLLLADGPAVLVMTSGNRVEEPIARDNHEAQVQLAGIADAFLFHDREIHTRADDSVVRVVAGSAQFVRRSRGVVPEAISLGCLAPPLVAVGAELKNTVCLTRGDQAYLSPHIGDLGNRQTHAFFIEVIAKLSRLLGVMPEVVAHDLHPDYLSTRWALDSGLRREPVQHHHAHIAACLTDHGRAGPVIGIAFDGTGCGPAGDLWGGEVLLADLTGFVRLAHLHPIALLGGEAAIHQPWRLAAAALLDAGLTLDALARIPQQRLSAVTRLLARAPRSTGAGRWFDAAAALCGVRDTISYEGHAAVELEALAAPGDQGAYPFDVRDEVLDLRPTIRALADEVRRGVEVPVIAARFHHTLALLILAAARRGRVRHRIECVALSGGCFQNRLLSETATSLLAADGFEVLLHRRVPPNDGGVALGQAAVAAHRYQHRHQSPSKRSAHVSGHSW